MVSVIEFNLPGLAAVIASGLLVIAVNQFVVLFIPIGEEIWVLSFQAWGYLISVFGLIFDKFTKRREAVFGLNLSYYTILGQIYLVCNWIERV